MFEIISVFLGIFLAQLSPGPNMMAVASASLGSGRSAGLATSFGVATGVFIWCILFSIGIGALLQAFPETLIAMRFLGGVYLLFLGLRSLKSAFASVDAGGNVRQVVLTKSAAYKRGLLVVMTNPKAALMWVAISMLLATSVPGVLQFLAIGIGASLSAAVIYGVYALLFSTGIAVRNYQRFFRMIEGPFGLIFGALGGRLIFDGIKALRPS